MSHAPRGTHGNPADLAGYIARLESPERSVWQMPDQVVAALALRPGHAVADVGAGPGYFAFRLARKVGRQGRVFAVDVEPALLAVLRERVAAHQGARITPVLGLPSDPLLPEASCDRVLSVNGNPVDYPNELQEVIFGARPGARPTIVIERDGNARTLHPTLVSWPSVTY